MKVTITKKANKEIEGLMSKYPNIEWFGLLYGKRYKKSIKVNKIHIPNMEKQEVAWVETQYILIEPKIEKDEFLGYIHSHHHMEAYFSCEDLKQFDQVNFAMVVSHNNTVAKYKNDNKEIKDIKEINFEN